MFHRDYNHQPDMLRSSPKEPVPELRYEYLDPSGKYMMGVQGHPEKPDTEEHVREELFARFFRHVSTCQD